MSVLPAAVTRNWTLKLASLGLAVFLWAVVRAEPPDREVLAEVPVLVQIGDLDWREAAPPEPASVQVRFAGPARQILALNRASAAVRVPLDEVSSPDTTVQLRRDWVVVDGGSGLVVEDVLPSTVEIHLERTTLEAIPVALSVTGTPREGYALAGPVTATPGVVRLRGPGSRVAGIDSIRTQPVDLDDLDASTRVVVPLDTTGFGDLTFNLLEVEALVRIEEAADRMLPPVAIEIEGPAAAGLVVEPESLAVAVRGPASRTSGADLSGLRLVVSDEDVLDVEPGEVRRVPLRVMGLDDPFLRVLTSTDSVTVRRRPTEVGGAGAAADSAGGGAP